jgi:outer membrane protein assembly factor BamB
VVDALQQVAERSQAGVRGLLRAAERAGAAREVRSFWVFNGFAATVDAATLEQLAAHPDVASVSLDEEIVLPEPPGEPRLPIWNLEKVHAPTVWGDYGLTGDGVVVGIMDSGADGSHPSLAPRYRGRGGDHATSWFAATGENYPTPGDGHGHGTHVAGTIVGGAPGEITGVAPDAEWIMAKIFRDSGSTSSSIIHAGFEWMLAPGGDPAAAPDVVSNSWGSSATYSTEFLPDVQAWVAAGILPVFAAGNDGPGSQTIGSPGSFAEVLAVGATDVNDLVAGFSSRGPVIWDGVPMVKPDIAAPGAAITSTWPLAIDPDGYHTISGTSMATPHVTGVVALLLEAEPDLEVASMRELLTSTARVEPHMGRVPNNDYGTGIVDAEAAVVAATLSGRLSGTITGPSGPMEATVAIPALGLSTSSDATTGFYELVVHEGTWEVEVSAYGFVPQTHTIEIAIDQDLTLDVALETASVHTVSGTVTAGGAPVPGAVVRAQGASIGPDYTDAEGAFSLEIAAGTYVLSADATGYRRATETLVVDGDRTVDLVLEPLAQGSDPAWRQYQNNAARTGFSSEALAGSALEPAWTTRASGQAFFSSPVVADGSVYLVTVNGRLNALDAATGETLWTVAIGDDTRSTPAVADGRVFVGGGQGGVFRALDANTGTPLWTYETGDWLTYAAPTVVDGVVFFGTGFANGPGGWVYALDAATGALRWRTFVGSQIFFAPAIGGGLVFAASYDEQRLVALDALTGAAVWSLDRDGDTFLAMPSYADGVLYATTTGLDGVAGSLLAIDAASGAVLWENADHGDGAGNAPVIFGELVIAGSDGKNWVRGYERATGAVQWTAPIGAAVSNSQLAADGVIVGGSQQDHRAWALDAYTGELLWEETLSDNVLSAPALADGRLVIATRRGDVYAFTAPGSLAGVVTDATGGPLAATVLVRDTEASTQTDPATGAYELSHAPGEVTVEARSYGYLAETASATIRGGQTTEVDFSLEVAGDGALAGTVRDEAGGPLEGVELILDGTPLDPATSAGDGTFGWPTVAEGTYDLVAALPGYAQLTTEVTVTEGATTSVELVLPRYDIAVTGDYGGTISRVLAAEGYLVESTTAAAIADRPDDYRLIVANGAQDDPGEAAFEALVANAAATETSIVFLDTWGISYGSIEHLKKYLGDPATTGSGYSDGEVSLVARAAHPLTAALGAGARVPVLAPDSEYAWFAGFGGRSVADVYIGAAGRTVGSGIGYAPTGYGSANVLLSLHGASPWAGPTLSWQPTATALFTDAVDYALGATFGAAAGTVTDGAAGVPARVSVVETGETTTAAPDGSYRLLLAPGDVTLRFERIGYATVDQAVTVVAREEATVDVTLSSTGLGGIAGTVTGPAGPIAGAMLRVAGTELTATTDASGAYAIDAVPGGTYSVEASADGHVTRTIEGVEVVDGAVTNLDVALRASLRAAVIGDYLGRLAGFLNANEVIATSTGWEAIDQLDDYDLVIVNDPTDPGEAAFLAHLDALDAAGVSAIFLTDWTNSGGGIQLLNEHVGDPATYDREWGPGVVNHVPVAVDHPLYAGLDASGPIQILTEDTNSAYFADYSGVALSGYEAGNRGVIGTGAAFEPRSASSVRLLLSGLGVNAFSQPGDEWTPEAERVMLNALDWASAPGLAVLQGRVTDAAGAPLAARVEIVETGLSRETAADGGYAIGHLGGDFTVEVSAFGYATRQFDVTLVDGETTTLDVELAIGEVGEVSGVVTSSGSVSPQAAVGDPIAGATVQLVGAPRSAVTAEDGSFVLPNVEPGTYQLDVRADGHVRRIVEDVTVAAGAVTTADVGLRVSPLVGVVDDCQQRTQCLDKTQRYLELWGYQAEELAWTDLDRIGELDLVIANLGDFPRVDPGASGLAAFRDAADRAHVPIVWADQYQRGSIRYLADYEGDPVSRSEARTRGVVHARILAEHPLTAGFAVGTDVPILGTNAEHAWFNDYSGTTVASLVTSAGEVGSTIAYRGRTASTVDVLVSALGITYYTWPELDGEPAGFWNENTERLFHNAINYALDAPPLAAEATGVVTSSAGGILDAEIRVAETGEAVHTREGDGTYLLPLQPGSWTIEVSAFGHATATHEVTVIAGQVLRLDVTLAADAVGTLSGTITDAADAPIAGAEVALEGTPLSATTDASGAFTIGAVPIGDYTAAVRATGFETVREPVTISEGATTTLNLRLTESRIVAVAGDYLRSSEYRISGLLEGAGYEVRQWSWSDVQNHVGELGDVALVILNGNGTDPTAAELTTFVEAADAAEVPIIVAGQYGGGAFEDFRDAFGDPPTVGWDFTAGAIHYRPASEHPIFAGFAVGEPIELVRDPAGGNQQYVTFEGYSGTELATLEGADAGGDGLVGDGVAYRFSSPTSVHLLLASLGASTYGFPGTDGDWTEDAERVYLNAVAWAIEATQGEVYGTVTSGGEPVADATVRALEAGVETRTGADGSYRLGVPDGTHTIRVTLDGYEPFETTVTVAESEAVQLDVELVRVPRGAIAGTVLNEADAPIAGATVTLSGPMTDEAVTAADGTFGFDDLLPGMYAVDVTAGGFLPNGAEVEVVAGETAPLTIRLTANDVGVLGDVDGAFVDFLRDNGLAAEELTWTDAGQLERYDVLIVNGGEPSEDEFTSMIAAADEAMTSVIFTGSWGVETGGIRLLERVAPDEVEVGDHGYRDGAVTITGFDAEHPLFANLDDPFAPVADDGYWSALASYVGHPLADLAIGGAGDDPAGLAAAYDFRSAESVHLLLAASAATDLIGPGYGWTEDGARLLLNAVAWTRDVEQPLPSTPTLATEDATPTTAASATLTGTAEYRTTVTILRAGEAVESVEPDRDGTFSVVVELVEGPNGFTAVASNFAGDSLPSDEVVVVRDTTGPVLDWTPVDGAGFFEPSITAAGTALDAHAPPVTLLVNGAAVPVAGDGSWSTTVGLVEGANVITVSATDALGNETVESRTVGHVPYSATWQVAAGNGRGALPVFLAITDEGGSPTQVSSVTLDVIGSDGTVVDTRPMIWETDDERYHALVPPLPRGTYGLVARLEVEGWNVTLAGPEVTRR